MTLIPSPSGELALVRVAATGAVDVIAEDRIDVEVRGDADVTHADGATTISSENGRLRIIVPIGVDLVIGTASGRVAVTGDVGTTSVITESGKVAIERAQSADVRSDTGRIDIGQTDGSCRVRSKSGSISVASCQQASVATGSGRITLHGVRGAVHAHCTSGRIEIEMAAANDIEAETITGSIAVSFPEGVRAFHSDRAVSQVAPDDADCVVSTRSVTGRVDVDSR